MRFDMSAGHLEKKQTPCRTTTDRQKRSMTAGSTFPFNQQPSISADGAKVLFKCGTDSYDNSSICEVKSNGTGFRVSVATAQADGSTFLNQPDYGPAGSIVFEEAENYEQIWRLPSGGTLPVKITEQFHNDNSPCVLPNGRIASLLTRTNPYELKIMAADGSSYFILMPGEEVTDIGLGYGP